MRSVGESISASMELGMVAPEAKSWRTAWRRQFSSKESPNYRQFTVVGHVVGGVSMVGGPTTRGARQEGAPICYLRSGGGRWRRIVASE